MEFADRWLLWILGPLYLLWALWWFVLPKLRGATGGGAVRFSTLRQLLRIQRSRSLALRRCYLAIGEHLAKDVIAASEGAILLADRIVV